MSDLKVRAVSLSAPRSVEMRGSVKGGRANWTDITIELQNQSNMTTFYVRSEVEGLQYDATTGTLKLVLAELPPPENIHIGAAYREPRFTPVLPEKTAVISVTIPVQINRVDFPDSGLPSLQVVDISGVRRVEVSIAHDKSPFRAVTTDHPIAIRKELVSWGTLIEYACECHIPSQGTVAPPTTAQKPENN